VGIRLTSLFGYDQTEGPFVRSLLHIDARGLTFTEEPQGRHRAVINVFTVALDERGQLSEPVAQKYTVRVRDERLEKFMRDGLVYELMTPVKKPGIYQVRAAVQDTESDRIGSASQFIEVPDINNKRLSLSGIVISAASNNRGTARTQGASSDQEPANDAEVQTGPAVRRFRRGMRVKYGFILMNAQLDQATGQPQVDTRVVLYREGKAVFTGPITPLNLRDLKDPKQIVAGGTINLGAELEPGEYVLQLIVTDKLAAEKKYQTTTRWIDFDLVD